MSTAASSSSNQLNWRQLNAGACWGRHSLSVLSVIWEHLQQQQSCWLFEVVGCCKLWNDALQPITLATLFCLAFHCSLTHSVTVRLGIVYHYRWCCHCCCCCFPPRPQTCTSSSFLTNINSICERSLSPLPSPLSLCLVTRRWLLCVCLPCLSLFLLLALSPFLVSARYSKYSFICHVIMMFGDGHSLSRFLDLSLARVPCPHYHITAVSTVVSVPSAFLTACLSFSYLPSSTFNLLRPYPTKGDKEAEEEEEEERELESELWWSSGGRRRRRQVNFESCNGDRQTDGRTDYWPVIWSSNIKIESN